MRKPLYTVYIYNILAEAARLRRASTAMALHKKRNTHDGFPMMALPKSTICEPCMEVRILSL